MDIVKKKAVQELATRLAKMDPRKRRGFMDSIYAGMKQGKVCGYEAGAIEAMAEMLQHYGFVSHAKKLLTDSHYSHNALKIDAICTHYAGIAEGHQTLSLGSRIVNSGPGWSVTAPLSAYVVPTGNYKLGQVLDRLPAGAVPVEQFFAAAH